MNEPIAFNDLFEDGITDYEFIKGNIRENYPIPFLSEQQYLKLDKSIRDFIQENQIEVTRKDNGKSRKYAPAYYAELHLENYLEVVDNTAEYHDKLSILDDAKYKIDELVSRVNKTGKHNFSRIFERIDSIANHINSRIDNLRNRKEFELPSIETKKKFDNIPTAPKNKNYSQRQIAIAYFCMGEMITKANADEILKEHSQTRSKDKLLQKRITTNKEITNLSENKTTDTKNLLDLKKSKRLLSGIKNQENAIRNVDSYITVFEQKYTAFY